MRYVLGFLFDPSGQEVVLIKKKKPLWQAGRLNGVGGKIEEYETARKAMVREFKEETGVFIEDEKWTHFGIMKSTDLNVTNWAVELFYCFSPLYEEVRTLTDEYVTKLWVDDLTCFGNEKIISNLPWLIHLALNSAKSEGPLFSSIQY
jgi:8-oxo-dGTP diphosphatase